MPIEITGVEKNGIFVVEKARLPDHSEKSVRLVLSSVPGLELSEKQIKAICALCLNNLFEFIKNDGAAELLSNVLRGAKKNEMAHKIIATVRRLQNIYDDYNIFLQYNFPIDKIELLLKKNITLQDVKKKPYSILLKYEVPVDIVDLFAIRECNVNAISLKRYKGFVLDADKFRFKMKQKEKKNRQAAKKIVTKEIVFSPHIAENDAEVKMRHIRKILKTGNKVKLTILMRGREIKFIDKNLSTLNRYAVELKDCAIVQSGPTVDKRSIHILLIPKN